MARRSREELLAEFHRLYDIFEIFNEFEQSKMSPGEAKEHQEDIPSRDDQLSLATRRDATLSEVLAGTREGINDQNEMLFESIEDQDGFAEEFLKYYDAKTGRSYWEDAGHPRKMARTILKRGSIADEVEYRLLSGVLSNVDQSIFNADEVQAINRMFLAFEAKL